ncbi:uncharacterized protein LOC119727040 isoform X2 [Patiria miniata]|uniref:C3H1-type domain-containing protein n=1 Tax=Patiria miniata TaxID=46514 RepID=A0A913ZUE5_PATMI|nr:uncharacterized protein LOC119727040 isoform X1 [Patiria miniata]XP_038054861.1 uncharacterized protein LOC119727040 isoform X2 [Patiria miniata]
MASSILVADYGSSDSENEEETSAENADLEKKGLQPSAGVNLLASAEDKTDSDGDSDGDAKGDNKNKTASSKQNSNEPEKLPLPTAFGMDAQQGLLGMTSAPAASSIFANPFQEAEQHKLSILEQHVKLTSAQGKEAELGGKKKICWKFRNGRCRFGHKCKFAHDSDVPATLLAGGQAEDTTANDRTAHHQHIGGGADPGAWLGQQGAEDDGDEEEGQLKRKRRPGLSQTLVPSKKVMTGFARQRSKESPWSQHR